MGVAKKIIESGLKAVAKKAPRMSEALEPHIGKRLYITQADRTALDYPQGLLGGPGYTELATIDPAKYKDIAWAVQGPGVAKTMVGSMARNPEEAIWANLIGSPEQHRSNKVVFDKIMDRFQKAVEEDKLTPELHKTINKRLANIKDPKTGKSFFPEDVDVLSPEFEQHAQTFHQRAYIADILAGKGVGGRKGTIIDYPSIIKETTDPLLLEAKTGDIGDRLFSLSGNIEYKPELHPAFHTSLGGRKESEAFAPAPQGIVLKDFIKDFTERTGRLPTYYDLTRGYAPSEKITEEMVERMYKEGYAEGGAVADDAEEYGEQLKEQRKTLGSDILKSGAKGITEGVGNILRSAKETLSRAGTIGDIVEGYGKYAAPMEKARYESVTGKKFPELKPISLLPDQAITESPVGAKILPFTTGEQQFAGEVLGDPLSYSMSGAGRGIQKVGKFLGRGLAEQVQTGKGIIGRNVINPRANIIKDPGGMLVGGERDLDEVLLHMKKTEDAYPHAQAHFVTDQKDPNAVALNQWIDTKVRKYIRNQAGSEADPIRKLVDEGVPYGFTESSGDNKFVQGVKRKKVGKPTEGISQTPEGKNWEYTVDSIFSPTQSNDIKEILNNPNIDDARKKSKLRVELDLPIITNEDYEAIKLINEISDKNVYDLNPTGLTQKLGLNHVSDVLMEDLRSGKLKPEQLNQMSIEKAIRRTAEYDAQKAKEMAKANAASAEGMPIPKEYNDGFKWVELKYTEPKDYVPEGYDVSSMTYDDGRTVYFANTPTTRSSAYKTREEAQKELNDKIKGLKSFREKGKTKEALTSEGEIMGHCVGSYCEEVSRGDVKIYSLRGPDGKSHVTIEARPQISMTAWRDANMDLINRNPELQRLDFNMRSLDDDNKYGHRMTERDYIREMSKEMQRRNIEPIAPQGYMELHQVKGKQNKRPDEKYQKYVSDFIKNNPTEYDIVDVKELDNTNLMNVQDIFETGLVDKDTHNHPEVEKILKMLHPEVFRADAPNIPKAFSRSEELKYDLFKEAAEDLARQGNVFLDKDDILNHLREKYLLPKKKSGGSINLNQEYKLENLRRRYG